MKYRRDIDCLRGLSVVLVVLYHAFGFPSGGYIGVDVFFVISGFLITGLLTNEMDSGRLSYSGFLYRRIRRLLPAGGLVALITLLVGWWILLPEDYASLGGCLASQPVMSANIFNWKVMKAGYFGELPWIYPLLHTWSLAVEEQFYLLYPFLFKALQFKVGRSQRKTVLIAVVGIGSLSSLLLSWCLTKSHPVLAYFLLPTRAWELGLGALLTLTGIRTSSRCQGAILSISGVLMVIGSAIMFTGSTPFPGLYAFIPCLGASALIVGNATDHRLKAVFCSSQMLWIGLISYPLYLWHWPLLAFLQYYRLGNATISERCLVVCLSVVLAFLTWRFIETPIRHKAILHNRKQVWILAGSVLVIEMVVGLMVVRFHGVPKRGPDIAETFMASKRNRKFAVDWKEGEKLVSIGEPSPKVDFILWGDSHAMSLAPVLDELGKKYSATGLMAAHSSTPPGPGKLEDAVFHELDSSHKQVTVFLTAFWRLSGYRNTVTSQDLEVTVAKLLKRKCRVIFVTDVPTYAVDIPRYLALNSFLQWNSSSHPVPLPAVGNSEAVKEFLKSSIASKVEVVNPNSAFIEDGVFIFHKDEKSFYVDSNHLTTLGSDKLSPLLEPYFRRPVEHSADTNP